MGFSVYLKTTFECDYDECDSHKYNYDECDEDNSVTHLLQKDIRAQVKKIRSKYVYKDGKFFCNMECYNHYKDDQEARLQRQAKIQAEFDALPDYVKQTIGNRVRINDVMYYADMMAKAKQHVYVSELAEKDFANISNNIDKYCRDNNFHENVTMKIIVDAIMAYCDEQYNKLTDEVAPI